MPTVMTQFDSYKLWYYSGSQSSYEALIYCYKGSKHVGQINFEEDHKLAQNSSESFGPVINYPISRFNDVMTILKEEKPLCLFLNTTNGIGIVSTVDREPVGEEET